jgi:hypothetical protein
MTPSQKTKPTPQEKAKVGISFFEAFGLVELIALLTYVSPTRMPNHIVKGSLRKSWKQAKRRKRRSISRHALSNDIISFHSIRLLRGRIART